MATNDFRLSPLRPSSSRQLPRWLSALIGVLFFGLAQPLEVTAHPFLVIDQRNDAFVPTGGFGFGAAPLGQEFTPSLTALNAVEILIGPKDPAAVAVVNIRADSITGPIVGTSLPGIFEPDVIGSSWIHFGFAALVALVPGDRYVIEPVIISGLAFGPVFSDADTYPGGRAIVFGSPLLDRDMGFREGLAVPEPATLSLLVVGLVVVAGRMVRRRRTRP